MILNRTKKTVHIKRKYLRCQNRPLKLWATFELNHLERNIHGAPE